MESLVPDVIDTVPNNTIEVTYPENKLAVTFGNELKPAQVKDEPSVKWPVAQKKLYTLLMVDPDAPNREDPKFREWLHWLVTNIRGYDISTGEVICEYVGAAPPKKSGLHRYVFQVFEQPDAETLIFQEKKIRNNTGNGRSNFSTRNFTRKYRMVGPVAANYFQAQWDTYVLKIYQQLGSK